MASIKFKNVYLNDYKTILNELKESERLNNLWNKYIAKRSYANNIKFINIIKSLDNFLENNLLIVYN